MSVNEHHSASRSTSWILPAAVVAAGLVAYANSLCGPFIFDDGHIREDPRFERFLPFTVTADTSRPIAALSLAFNVALSGMDVRGFHLTNLAIHLLCGVLLFGIVRNTLQSDLLRERYGAAASWLAWAVALIWTVHPLQTQSVTYIIQRCESLMGLFYLLTLYCFIRGSRPGCARGWHAAAVACCACGMATKEVMITAPLMVLCYDRQFVSHSLLHALRRRRVFYGALAMTCCVLGGLWLFNVPPDARTTAGFFLQDVTPFHYAAIQPGVILHYLKLTLWPATLCLDYYDWPRSASTLDRAVTIGSVLVMLIVALRWTWKRSPIGYPAMWCFVVLAPTSSFMPISDLAFEHRMYLPLAGVAAGAVIGAFELLRRPGRPNRVFEYLGIGSAVALCAVLIGLTLKRNQDYRSAVAIWTDAVEKRPGNARAQHNLGAALARSGRPAEAEFHYRQALVLEPEYARAHHHLGTSLLQQERVAEGSAHIDESLRLDPRNAQAHNDRGLALVRQGRMDEALQAFTQSLRIDPRNAAAHNNAGTVMLRRHRLSEARTCFAAAIRVAPACAEAHAGLASVLLQQGYTEQALHCSRDALSQDPTCAEAHQTLGIVLAQRGRIEEAVEHFQCALDQDPSMTTARKNLERALALSAGQAW